MIKKIHSFLDNNCSKVATVCVVLGVIISIILIAVDGNRSIEDQKLLVYRLSQYVEEDITCVTELEDIEMYVGEQNIRITIREKDCELELVYDKESSQLQSKTFKDNRIAADFGTTILAIIVFGIFCTLGITGILYLVIMGVLMCIIKLQDKKKNQVECDENHKQNI